MIWGRTYEQDRKFVNSWRRRWAWRPVRLDDGRWAWLQTVWWRCVLLSDVLKPACLPAIEDEPQDDPLVTTLLAKAATNNGFLLRRHTQYHWQLRTTEPPLWIYDFYPSTGKLVRDANHRGPLLTLKSGWTIADAIKAAGMARRKALKKLERHEDD